MKLFLRIILVLALLLAVLIGFNWTKIKRLQTVNTLFDEGRIVTNFSNMDAAFLHQDLEISDTEFVWPETPTPLPDTVNIGGKDRNLEALLDKLETTAFIVIQDGKILNENYYLGTKKDDLRISWSMAKSFMSGLYGQALEGGQIKSLDDKVETYVPELKGSAYEGVTLRNVLNMASGVQFNEDYMDPKSDINKMGRVLGLGRSMDKFTTSLKERQDTPGTKWQYVSIDTHVAAMALRAATGKSLHELFNDTYGANLGFGKAPYYLTDGENVAFALGGLNMRTRDYAKFGQLFLQDGMWQGQQIIPADWVEASTKPTAPGMPDQGVGYGYQWWVPMPQDGMHKGDFFAVGIYGQYIYVNPAANLVIAKNAAHREFTYPLEDMGDPMGINIQIFRSLAEHYMSESDSDNNLTSPSNYAEASFSIFEPMTFSDIDGQDDLFGCGCNFFNEGKWLFSAGEQQGFFKQNDQITRMPATANAESLPYTAVSKFELNDLLISLSREANDGKEAGLETREWEGSMTLTTEGKSHTLVGTLQCGC